MATTTSITSTYAGEFAGQYISAALLSASTIENGGITVKPNVKFKETIKKVSTDDIVKDASCDFTATSTITLTERVLQPEFQQVNLQLCKKDFISDWEAVQMGYSAHHDLPPAFSDFLIAHVAAKVAQRTENSIWAGDTSTSGQFNGLTTQIALDADLPAAQEVAGTTVTAANVITELGSIVDAIPSTLYGNEDLNVYVSQNIARAYVRALGGFGASGLGAAGTNNEGTQWWNNGSLSFDGVKLFVANGLADNTAVAAEKSNLYFGTGLLADHNEVKVLDMSDLDGSDNIRVVMRFTAGVQYGIVDDIVTYGITNSAN
jgi:hypothetical protein|tara:strand:+ start:834 stop:1787 length:954 start_codon:yes stop_codon:yes gene_type:complete